jgi:hypothetical protein
VKLTSNTHVGPAACLALVLAVQSLACVVCASDTRDTVTIELVGVSEDLNAVIAHNHEYLSVGAGGTVVRWSPSVDGAFVDRFDVGEAELHAVWANESTYWVVGAGGAVAVSDNAGQSWENLVLADGADLHAITRLAERLIIVGDDVVLARSADGTWATIAAPASGWGELRDVHVLDQRVHAVGLSGAIRSSSDPSSAWDDESNGTVADLQAIGEFGISHGVDSNYLCAVGTDGTVLIYRNSAWTEVDSGIDIDLVDYDHGFALGAGGEVVRIDGDGTATIVDTMTGARALTYDGLSGFATVGLGGVATAPGVLDC